MNSDNFEKCHGHYIPKFWQNKKCCGVYLCISWYLYVFVNFETNLTFLFLSVHTMGELKMTGNCLRGARPLLSFDPQFNEPHWALMKELFIQTFGIPNYHPKSQPFHDHVYSFTIVDDRIWFRNYEILAADGKLSEIGKCRAFGCFKFKITIMLLIYMSD